MLSVSLDGRADTLEEQTAGGAKVEKIGSISSLENVLNWRTASFDLMTDLWDNPFNELAQLMCKKLHTGHPGTMLDGKGRNNKLDNKNVLKCRIESNYPLWACVLALSCIWIVILDWIPFSDTYISMWLPGHFWFLFCFIWMTNFLSWPVLCSVYGGYGGGLVARYTQFGIMQILCLMEAHAGARTLHYIQVQCILVYRLHCPG